MEVVRTYTVLGIEHILAGFDHLCFVLALVMIVGFNRKLIWTVTAFTVAHSITLAAATVGVIRLPGPPVEAIIALSIVFVASEVIQQQRGSQGLATKKPWVVAFAFGLLQASALPAHGRDGRRPTPSAGFAVFTSGRNWQCLLLRPFAATPMLS